MKKSFKYLLISILFIFPLFVQAACDSNSTEDCAYCEYKLSDNYYDYNFNITYKSGASNLDFTFNKEINSSTNSFIPAIVASFADHFTKSDFLKNELECPTIYYVLGNRNVSTNPREPKVELIYGIWPFDENKYNEMKNKINYSYEINNNNYIIMAVESVSATDEMIVKGTSPSTEEAKYCKYTSTACGEIFISLPFMSSQDVRISNPNISLILGDSFNYSGFNTFVKDRNVCPNVFTKIYNYGANGGNRCYISLDKVNDYTDSQGALINQNDGSEISDKDGSEIIPKINDCSSLLGDPKTKGSPAFYITFAFKVVRYIAIILLIILTVMDFVTAAASHDEDSLQKAIKKTVSRLIICVIIFILPILINLLLEYLFNIASSNCLDL